MLLFQSSKIFVIANIKNYSKFCKYLTFLLTKFCGDVCMEWSLWGCKIIEMMLFLIEEKTFFYYL